LYVASNPLMALPEWLGGLTQLRVLHVSGNQLTALPEALGKLTQLQQLDVGLNQLTVLPEWLGRLTQLQQLDVSNNQLTMLPQGLLRIESLRSLYLQDNEKLGIPEEILGGPYADVLSGKAKASDPKAILDYYFRTRAGRRPLNEAKLVLVGFGGVGKTSLVNRLVRGRFDPHEGKTEEIASSTGRSACGTRRRCASTSGISAARRSCMPPTSSSLPGAASTCSSSTAGRGARTRTPSTG
jgi:internalin A